VNVERTMLIHKAAKKMGVSSRRLYKWIERDTGKKSPRDRLEHWASISLLAQVQVRRLPHRTKFSAPERTPVLPAIEESMPLSAAARHVLGVTPETLRRRIALYFGKEYRVEAREALVSAAMLAELQQRGSLRRVRREESAA
jgi:transposase